MWSVLSSVWPVPWQSRHSTPLRTWAAVEISVMPSCPGWQLRHAPASGKRLMFSVVGSSMCSVAGPWQLTHDRSRIAASTFAMARPWGPATKAGATSSWHMAQVSMVTGSCAVDTVARARTAAIARSLRRVIRISSSRRGRSAEHRSRRDRSGPRHRTSTGPARSTRVRCRRNR